MAVTYTKMDAKWAERRCKALSDDTDEALGSAYCDATQKIHEQVVEMLFFIHAAHWPKRTIEVRNNQGSMFVQIDGTYLDDWINNFRARDWPVPDGLRALEQLQADINQLIIMFDYNVGFHDHIITPKEPLC